MTEPLILASKSKSRAAVLGAAGLNFQQIGSGVDEDTLKSSLRAEGASVMKQADLLAETKAAKVSTKHRGIVLGCDQMLECDGEAFDKVETRDAARDVLKRLRGKTHILHSAIVACIDGAPVWRHMSQPRLRMRNFSDPFLESYLDSIGSAAFEGVGCYQVEGRGATLFDRIEGDHFSILGMPLLPLLQWLRDRGAIAS
ncbi:MAG TPA: Maf family protein [Hyphomonadaceae bacterium]|nr:Maf family protein [Hyphomonadaceae bacterium]